MATSDSEDFESADEDLELVGIGSQDSRKKSSQATNAGKSLGSKTSCGSVNHTDDSKLKIRSDTTVPETNDDCASVTIKKETVMNNKLHMDDDTKLEGKTDCTTNDNLKEDKSKRGNDTKRDLGSNKKLGVRIGSNPKHISVTNKIIDSEPEAPSSECGKIDTMVDTAETLTNDLLPKAEGWEEEVEELSQELLDSNENPNEEKFGSIFDKLAEPLSEKANSTNSSGGWGSWGGWGVSSLLSTATESVSTLTSHVSQGLSTVLETGIGAPDPEELARLDLQEKQNVDNISSEPESKLEEAEAEESSGLFGFGRVMSGVTSITKLVETTGSKVLSGGLDTLETIGKKTMEVLQEGDPGLKKKRALFTDKTVLSQVLREAKEKAEHEDRELKDKEAARKAHFETLFDDYQGLVHLEALEMLSKQCDLKLQSMLLSTTGPSLTELQQALTELKEQCQLPDDEDTEESDVDWKDALAGVDKGLGVHLPTDKLTKTWDETEQWLEECHAAQDTPADGVQPMTARHIHQKAMATLARLTAESVEQFHKAAELLLVLEERNPSQEAKILLDMTSVLSSQVTTAATRFSERLNITAENSVDSDSVNALITNVFYEASNSSSYIQEGFQLLVPVLQVGVTAR